MKAAARIGSPPEGKAHGPVGNAGVVEHRPVGYEPESHVEVERDHLGVQRHRGVPSSTGLIDQPGYQGAADTGLTPRRQHGYASDVTICEQTRGAEGLAVWSAGERVQAAGVLGVPLQFLGDALLLDEDAAAHQGGPRRGPGPVSNAYHEPLC